MPVPINQLIWRRSEDLNGTWNRKDIYDYNNDAWLGRLVPKVDDLVYDRTLGWLIVDFVDGSTGESTLNPWRPIENVDESQQNVLLGRGPGLIAESYRLYVDTSVMPHTLAFDTRLHIYGSTAESVKVFLGSDVTATGIVVSAYYNQANTLVGENIPLELVQNPGHDILAIKTPRVGVCNRPLETGELVTAVVYDSVGGVRSKALLVVENTNVIRTIDASARYITDIFLRSSFLSETDGNRIEYPVGVTTISTHMTGVVRYNTGQEIAYPIDASKFSLPGINSYIPTQVGQRIPVTLSYKLDANEFTNGSLQVVNGEYITRPYEVVTVEANAAYAVKLFAYPRWIDATHGYRMEYWLYTLDRSQYFYATPWVTHGQNTPAFDPTAYGLVQNLTLVVNLEQVNPTYFDEFRFIQPITVTLSQRGDVMTTPNWTVAFNPGQTPQYGTRAVATMTYQNVNTTLLDISMEAETLEEWLNFAYYQTFPLFSPSQENMPLVPNFVVLVFKDNELEISVNQWNTVLAVANDLLQGELLYLRFIKRDDNGDKQLSIAALPVHVII